MGLAATRSCWAVLAAALVLLLIAFSATPARAQAAPDGLAADRDQAVAWLKSQQEAVQSYRVTFDKPYDYDYVGPVAGSVEDATSLPGARVADPACPSDKIDGVEIRVFSRTDVDYLQEDKIPVCSDGSWRSTKIARVGTKIARLVKTSTNRSINSTEWADATSYKGLERSFFIPFDDPDYGYEGDISKRSGYRLEQRSWIYDDAVAVFALSAAGEYDRADAILGQLSELQQSDGSLVFSYDVYLGKVFDEYVRSGSLAWVGSAALAYEEKTGDTTYRPFARRLADYLLMLQVSAANGNSTTDSRYGSILGGFGRYDDNYNFVPEKIQWASTEHNIDAYFFLRDLGIMTGEQKYSDAATLVKQSLLNNHWNAAEGRFNQGVSLDGPDTENALDLGSWGGLFMLAIGERDRALSSANYIERFRVNGATIQKSSDTESYNQTYTSAGPIDGYKPYLTGTAYPNAPDVVWAEGTWGAILLKMRLGEDVSGDLASMQRMQAADPKGGFVQVTEGRRSLPYEFHVWPAVGGTAWGAMVMSEPGLLWKPDGWTPRPPTSDEPAPDPADNFGPSDNDSPSGGNPSGVGDPVNVTTGNVYDIKEDLNVPGRGLPLQFVRFYNSQDTVRKPLGHGWTHNYNTRLTEKTDGSVTELAPDGKRLVFTKNSDGSYSAPKGVHDTLTKGADGSYTLRKKNGVQWSFGVDGKLGEITDPNGNALLFSYDASGRLAKITDSVGRDIVLAYDGTGRLARITDPAGRTVRYAYSIDGELVSVTDPSGAVTRYAYDAGHNLTKITNADGGTTTFTYDAQDRAVSAGGDGGYQKITLAYDPANSKTFVTDSKGNQSAFYYDADEQITKIVDPYGKEISYTWDARGNKTSVTDQLGNTTSYEYDAAGNVTKIVQPKPTATALSNPTWTLSYESNFNKLTSVTDPEGATTRYTYGTQGNLVEMTDALGNKIIYEYDASGQLVKSTDSRGNASPEAGDGAITFTYDTSGNLTGITDPAGKTTSFSYGAADSLESVLSLPSSVTDALNRSTDFSYDALGRVTMITYPLTPPDTVRASVVMTYDGTGDLTSYINEKGNKSTYTYDALGQLTKVTDPLSKATLYAYDTEGNLASETDPAGNTTTYTYDKVRRLVEISKPDGTTNADGTPGSVVDSFGYDVVGRMTTRTDPRGFKTQFGYNALGNLTSTTDLRADGTTVASASYAYDLLGRMTKASNPNGHATTYSYDALGQLLKETDPLGNSFSYAYDENGNTKSRTDAIGRVTNYSYDSLDRLLTTAYPNGTKMEMSYDAVGNLLSATDETGTISYTYDERDRLTKETFPDTQVLKHAYDAASNRTSLTDPGGGKMLFEYDAASRLTGVTDRAGVKTTYAYNALDLPTKVSYPNGAWDAYAYDPLGRMTRAQATTTDSAGTAVALARLTYAYDKSSNPTSITNKAGKQSTFYYDALDRLYKEVHPDRTLSYTYDAAGNRKSFTRDTPTTSPTTTNYTYDVAERLTAAGATTFSHNNNGEMISRATGTTTTNYTYDYEGALTKAGTVTYARDPFGRAVSSTAGTTTTNYLFDGSEAVWEKTGADAAAFYTRGLKQQLISRRGGGDPLRYYHHDPIGSVVALTNVNGDLTDTYEYTAFGGVRERTGTDAQPYLYVGNAWNTTSKLYDFHARAYDPAVGRFTSKDPVAGLATMPQTLNPYAYGVNGPLAYPDPSGEFPPAIAAAVPVLASVGAAIASDYALNMGVEATHYLTTQSEDKPMDWSDFAETVTGEAADATVADLKDPLTFASPLRKFDKVSDVLRIADKVSVRNVDGGKATVDRTLTGAEKYLGEGYKEIAPGVYRSADGTRQFRMVDPSDIAPRRGAPHTNFEAFDPKTGKRIENSHVELLDD